MFREKSRYVEVRLNESRQNVEKQDALEKYQNYQKGGIRTTIKH
jgi:hypothetical protein